MVKDWDEPEMNPDKLRYILESARRAERDDKAEQSLDHLYSADNVGLSHDIPDPEDHESNELFRPLDDIEKQRILSASGWLGPQRPQRRMRWKRWGAGALAFAAAAALIVYFQSRPKPVGSYAIVLDYRDSPRDDKGARLLGHSSFPSGHAEVDGTTHLDRDVCPRLLLSPMAQGATATEVRAVFVRDRTRVPWDLSVERLSDGLLKSVGACVPLPRLSPGMWRLVVLVGRRLPNDSQTIDAAVRTGRSSQPSEWQVAERMVEIFEPAFTSPKLEILPQTAFPPMEKQP